MFSELQMVAASNQQRLIFETVCTVPEAMAKLKIKARNTMMACFDRGLEGFRIGRQIRTSYEAIDRFIEPIERNEPQQAAREPRQSAEVKATLDALDARLNR